MAILDILKKKKEKKEKKEKEAIKEPKAIKEEKVQKVPEAVKKRARKRKKPLQPYKALRSPHITEKATDLTKKDQYTFKVWPEANKIEVKRDIENLYDVEVVSVKIINVHPKRRRLGRTMGWRKGYKKAVIRIKEGQKIEVMPR